MKVLIAGFYTPSIQAIQVLFHKGIRPENIALMTYNMQRNQTLIEFANENSIDVGYWHIKSQEALDCVKNFSPDVILSLYYRDIIPQNILEIPPLGAINLHPSLLPMYRGAFAAPWMIINNEKKAGFTYHYMVSTVDTGNIVLQEEIAIQEDDTAFALYNRLLVAGMGSFEKMFDLVTEERFMGIPQTGTPSYFGRKVPFEGIINTSWSIEEVERFIRAMYFPPYKGALALMTDGSVKEIYSIDRYKYLLNAGYICHATDN